MIHTAMLSMDGRVTHTVVSTELISKTNLLRDTHVADSQLHYRSYYKKKFGGSFSLHCLQPISSTFSNVNKRSTFLRNFLAGVCFHGI